MKTITLTFASLALLSAGFSAAFLEPTAAEARDRHHKSSTKTAPPHQTGQSEFPAAGQANRQPNRHFPRNYYLNRPQGSATNTPRGYYRDHLSYDPPRHGEGSHDGRTIYVPQPVYYVVPPLFPSDQPLSFGDVRGPDQAVDPDQLGNGSQPVVIEADNLYVVSPDGPPAGAENRYESTGYGSGPTSPPIDRPVRNYGSVPAQSTRPAPVEAPKPEDPQVVSLSVRPADAVVWLDDEELGLAGDLAGSLVLEPGVYLLEVEHDGLQDQRLFFGVVDQPVDVRVDLTADEPRRRYRVR